MFALSNEYSDRPQPQAPEERSVSVAALRAFATAVERTGVPRQRLLRALKLPLERSGAAGARIPTRDFLKACERVFEVAGDAALGLNCTERCAGMPFDLLSLLVVHAASLRQAIDAVLRFGSLCSDCLELRLQEHEGRAILHAAATIESSLPVVRCLSEIWTSGMVQLIRHVNPGARIDQVCFAYEAPPYRSQYARVFDAAECFGQPFTGIVFQRALLDGVSASRDEELFASLSALAEQRARQCRASASFALRVREQLQSRRVPGRVPMGEIASALHVSVRTLHRRLSSEGRSYRTLIEDASATTAKRLLIEERCSIREVAAFMGFSDATAFHRAFKRWTGSTPTAFRSST